MFAGISGGKRDLFLHAAERAGSYCAIHLNENLDIGDFNPLIAQAYRKTYGLPSGLRIDSLPEKPIR